MGPSLTSGPGIRSIRASPLYAGPARNQNAPTIKQASPSSSLLSSRTARKQTTTSSSQNPPTPLVSPQPWLPSLFSPAPPPRPSGRGWTPRGAREGGAAAPLSPWEGVSADSRAARSPVPEARRRLQTGSLPFRVSTRP